MRLTAVYAMKPTHTASLFYLVDPAIVLIIRKLAQSIVDTIVLKCVLQWGMGVLGVLQYHTGI